MEDIQLDEIAVSKTIKKEFPGFSEEEYVAIANLVMGARSLAPIKKMYQDDPDAFKDRVDSEVKRGVGSTVLTTKNMSTQRKGMMAASYDLENQVSVKEDIEALFNGEELSEEFKQKAETIFETAIESKTAEIETIVEERYNELAEQYNEYLLEQYAEKVDRYIDYVVENWMTQNELAIESGLKSEITEGFISGLKDLFDSNYVDVPESKLDLVEDMNGRINDLQNRLDEQMDVNVELKEMNKNLQVKHILNEELEGLTDTEKEKIATLAEGISFNTIQDYQEKLAVLKESYLTTEVKEEKQDEQISDLTEEYSPDMSRYLRTLNRYKTS